MMLSMNFLYRSLPCEAISMREVAIFAEDFAHQAVLDALLSRIGSDLDVQVKPIWRNARRGHGAVVREFAQFQRDILRGAHQPDLIVVATDANCKGYNKRRSEIPAHAAAGPQVIFAIPDPHIERWLLLDSAAFKKVFGQGCDAPDQKCERDRYKRLLIENIHRSGRRPNLGGIEFAADIVGAMDLDRAARSDPSLGRFIGDLRTAFGRWQE